MSEPGSLWLLDKYGNVFVAEPDSTGGYSKPAKNAYIGPSRPLGHTQNAHGNLVVCDSAKVPDLWQICTLKAIVCQLACCAHEYSPSVLRHSQERASQHHHSRAVTRRAPCTCTLQMPRTPHISSRYVLGCSIWPVCIMTCLSHSSS